MTLMKNEKVFAGSCQPHWVRSYRSGGNKAEKPTECRIGYTPHGHASHISLHNPALDCRHACQPASFILNFKATYTDRSI
jgi:hypothetical protein